MLYRINLRKNLPITITVAFLSLTLISGPHTMHSVGCEIDSDISPIYAGRCTRAYLVLLLGERALALPRTALPFRPLSATTTLAENELRTSNRTPRPHRHITSVNCELTDFLVPIIL